MEMTNQEIVRRYLNADSKKSQVEILADLNATDPKTIRDILIEAGVMKKSGPKPKKLKVATAPVKLPEGTMVPPILKDAAHLGVEYITKKIQEKEAEIKEAQKALEDLKKQRAEILKTIHGLHPDNDGNLWYYNKDAQAVIVNE